MPRRGHQLCGELRVLDLPQLSLREIRQLLVSGEVGVVEEEPRIQVVLGGEIDDLLWSHVPYRGLRPGATALPAELGTWDRCAAVEVVTVGGHVAPGARKPLVNILWSQALHLINALAVLEPFEEVRANLIELRPPRSSKSGVLSAKYDRHIRVEVGDCARMEELQGLSTHGTMAGVCITPVEAPARVALAAIA